MEIGRQIGETRDLTAGRLRILAEVGARLSDAGDPLQVLGACLPDILKHLAADSARIMVQGPNAGQPVCAAQISWADAEGPDEAGLRAVIPVPPDSPQGRKPVAAAIEVRMRRAAEAIAAAGFDAGDRWFLDAIARLAGFALSQVSMRAELARRQRIAQDLALAAELQRSLLPDCDPDQMPIWGVSRPARQVSGDFFDFYQLDGEHFAFALGDVSGKGMNAALLMAKTISLFRCLGKRIDAPAELLAAINAELCETAARGMFVTMVAGQYGLRDGRVRFANAGHEPPLLRRKDRTYKVFPASTPPLGILPDNRPADEELVLDGGEFYVFSDGLTEYRYASGEQLGVEGLIQLVELYAAQSPARRLESVLGMLDQDGGWEACDDLTVLAIDDAWVQTSGLSEPPALRVIEGGVEAAG